MDAGSEANIPPELIQKAYQQLQEEQAEAKQLQVKRRQQLGVGVAIATAVTLLGTLWFGGTYNHLNASKSTVEGKWAQVENQLQRRADIIPQLTQVAQSYAGTEKEIIKELTRARAFPGRDDGSAASSKWGDAGCDGLRPACGHRKLPNHRHSQSFSPVQRIIYQPPVRNCWD
ncbi:LemA family protein [Acaryochloris marina NIES-2412]|uniref:LemA family protein n=1 Tax=Acaryochloris marina TaxID=155978 RepID=UPI0040583216